MHCGERGGVWLDIKRGGFGSGRTQQGCTMDDNVKKEDMYYLSVPGYPEVIWVVKVERMMENGWLNKGAWCNRSWASYCAGLGSLGKEGEVTALTT